MIGTSFGNSGIANSATVAAPVFICSICGEPSANICAYCTKDACANHRCERCKRCSDCCECDVPLSAEEAVALEPLQEPVFEPVVQTAAEAVVDPVVAPVVAPEVEPAPSQEPQTAAEPTERGTEGIIPDFLTPEEASVFDLSEPKPRPEPVAKSDPDEPAGPLE